MQLYGRKWHRRDLEARVGRLHQIGGIRRMQLMEGKESGTEIICVRTGAGLSFEITPSKGLDISLAELCGTPLSWQSPNGDVHPMYYESQGNGFLRSASGGLLMTCGLSNVGSPSNNGLESYGLHGRVHHTPARNINVHEVWTGDELEWTVSGIVEETALFNSKLILERRISGRLGVNKITIHDRVENIDFQPAIHMILYHFNFGFPLLDERTKIGLPPAISKARDPATSMERCSIWEAPDPDMTEAVYYHHLIQEGVKDNGMAEASLHQPAFPIGGQVCPVTVTLRWSADTLPNLIQWRMPGAGEHVLGLEPANCHVEGRYAEEKYGGIRLLKPGESVSYKLEISVCCN